MFWKNREFAEAYNDYYPVLFSIIYSKIRNIDDSEDLCQEIFVKFFEKLDTIENKRNWLLGTMRFEIMWYFRKKKKVNVDIDEIFEDISLKFVNGFRDTRMIINEAIEHTNNYKDEKEKTLFDLVAIRNFTYEEAGKQLGLTKRQVRYIYSKILERILLYLNSKGISKIEELL